MGAAVAASLNGLTSRSLEVTTSSKTQAHRGTHEISLRGAAHRGDMRAHGLDELDGEAADAAPGPETRDLLALLNAPVVVHSLQGGHPRDREGRRSLEGQAPRLVREPVVGDEAVLGESSPGRSRTPRGFPT